MVDTPRITLISFPLTGRCSN